MTDTPREIVLIKNGELALKGLNRGTFETALVKNLKRRLRSLGSFELRRAQSTKSIIIWWAQAGMCLSVRRHLV